MSRNAPPSNSDSARTFADAWNLGAEPAGLDPDDSIFGPPPRPSPAPDPPPAPAPALTESWSTSGLSGPIGAASGARGGPSAASAAAELDLLLGPSLPAGRHVDPDGPLPSAASAAGSGGPPTPPAPRAGEVISGFRIVAELGRGAFARVYLARQVDLGERPVALKISRAEGDEPQLLARLQHTHIVPIHSVHDDPATGLRMLCMPYLGGANLAQVIEASGTPAGGGSGRRSLVDALDEVTGRLPSAELPGVWRGLLPAGVVRHGAHSHGPTSRPGPAHASLSRMQAVWGRIAGLRGVGRGTARDQLFSRILSGGPGPAAAAAAGDGVEGAVAVVGEADQPARHNLRGADAVRASIWVVARLAEGLEHAHSRGLLHRDLKPSNVLIAGDGTPMLLDFNLSSAADGDGDGGGVAGERAMLGGTLPYMSPEHLDAFDPQGRTRPEAVDERSDIYALGLILFEMVAGAPPFPEPPAGLPLVEVIRLLCRQRLDAPSLRSARPGVPWGLESVVRKCLDPDQGRRYARARDLADDLNRLLDDRALKHAPEPSTAERLAKWMRRNPRLCGTTSMAALAVVLLVAVGGVMGLIQQNLRGLSTRLQLQVFRDDLEQCRFLLNLTSGPAEHLGRGVALADRTLDRQRLDARGDWTSESWAARLTPAEQAEVRGQVAELVLLVARARVFRADRSGSEAQRRVALEWAVRWLGRAERLDPAPPGALYGDRARYLSALGRGDLAARDRGLERRTPPATSRDFALLGSALLSGGDVGRAEAALARAVDLDPRAFWAWFALGHAHAEAGRHLDAAGDFAACVVLEPGFAWAHLNRGLALARAGRLTAARDAYARALEANPRFAEAWLDAALVDLELGDLAAAERGLAKALALGRREVGVLAAWAEVKARRGDAAGADREFSAALADRPGDPTLRTARGVARIGRDPAGARSDLLAVLRDDPHNARAHYGLALLLRHDSPAEALAQADAALRADPGLLDALQLRALLRARRGDPAAEADADRLAAVATPHRLYNAACVLGLLHKVARRPPLAARAVDLLDRSLEAGFPADQAAADPDLIALHGREDFAAALARPRDADPARAGRIATPRLR